MCMPCMDVTKPLNYISLFLNICLFLIEKGQTVYLQKTSSVTCCFIYILYLFFLRWETVFNTFIFTFMHGWLYFVVLKCTKYVKGTNHVNNPLLTLKTLAFTLVLPIHDICHSIIDYITGDSLTLTGVKNVVCNLPNAGPREENLVAHQQTIVGPLVTPLAIWW